MGGRDRRRDQTMTSRTLDIGIAGAGIGGLAADGKIQTGSRSNAWPVTLP